MWAEGVRNDVGILCGCAAAVGNIFGRYFLLVPITACPMGEFLMSDKPIIQLSMVVGDKEGNKLFGSTYRRLNILCEHHMNGRYFSDTRQLGILVLVDGGLCSFGVHGPGRPRRLRKDKEYEVDLVLEESRWRGASSNAARVILAKGVADAVKVMLGAINDCTDREAFIRDFLIAANEYVREQSDPGQEVEAITFDMSADAEPAELPEPTPVVVPRKIKVRREEGYHTDTIGRCAGNRQFMAFVVASLPSPVPEDWKPHKRWYAVLHLFDIKGQHRRTEAWFAGTTADGERESVEKAEAKLDEMLKAIQPVKFCDVTVKLFSVEVDGTTFGLVDASEEDEDYQSIHLLPNDLAFFPPWDGTYDT